MINQKCTKGNLMYIILQFRNGTYITSDAPVMLFSSAAAGFIFLQNARRYCTKAYFTGIYVHFGIGLVWW
jgi:uncharacterized membrane protein